jgi:hypothetical protein
LGTILRIDLKEEGVNPIPKACALLDSRFALGSEKVEHCRLIFLVNHW